MMICPKTYLDEHIVGKKSNEIKKEINKLKRTIRELKRVLENPMQDDLSFMCCPSPLVQLKCTFDYLNETILYLKEIGEEYVYSKSEQRAIDFSQNIKNIKKITFYVCGCFNIREPVEITFEGDKVIRTEYLLSEPEVKEMEDCDREGFLEDFDRLMIGTWRRSYTPDRFGICVMDGEGWELKIEYDNDFKTQVFGGSNAYSFNFSELCDLLGVDWSLS